MEFNYIHLILAIVGAVLVGLIATLRPSLFLFFAGEDKRSKPNAFIFTFLALSAVILPVYMIINIIDKKLLIMLGICLVLAFGVRLYYRKLKKEE